MRRIRVLLISTAFILLAGCATTENYERILQHWVGAHADRLVTAWGPPDSQYTLSDGSRVLQYSRRRLVDYGGNYFPEPVFVDGRTLWLPSWDPTYIVARVCITRFTVDPQGIVREWRWEGNDCIADAPPDPQAGPAVTY